MPQIHAMPSTIAFDQQFDFDLITLIEGNDRLTAGHLSGMYEVTASTDDGTWCVSDVFLTLDNGLTGFRARAKQWRLDPTSALYATIVERITAIASSAIEARIAEEGTT
jgi:hypothetical protein